MLQGKGGERGISGKKKKKKKARIRQKIERENGSYRSRCKR